MESEWWDKVHGFDALSITATILQCVLFLIILAIALTSFAFVLFKALRDYKLLFPYKICIVLVMLSCGATAVMCVMSSIYMQLDKQSNAFLCFGLTLMCYNASLTSIYALFIFRIHILTVRYVDYKISAMIRIALGVLGAVLASVQSYLLYLVAVSPGTQDWNAIDSISFISMALFYLGAASIIILFVTKLKVLLVDPDHVELSDCMARMTLLIVCSIASSCMVWVMLSTESRLKDKSRFMTYFYDVFVALDATINTACAYCSFPFGEKLYKAVFGKLHPKFKKWCTP